MAPRSATAQDPERQLMIKTKACQRLAKEVLYYEKEVEENEAKLEQMKREQKDPYDMKKFGEVLGESRMMIPDSRSRFQTSLEELSVLVDRYEEVESDWMTTAKGFLVEHQLKGNTRVDETNIEGLQDGEAF